MVGWGGYVRFWRNTQSAQLRGRFPFSFLACRSRLVARGRDEILRSATLNPFLLSIFYFLFLFFIFLSDSPASHCEGLNSIHPFYVPPIHPYLSSISSFSCLTDRCRHSRTVDLDIELVNCCEPIVEQHACVVEVIHLLMNLAQTSVT